jgi:hypothetical protein
MKGTSESAASARMRMSGREANDSWLINCCETFSGMGSSPPPFFFWAKATAGWSATAAA